jgi:hypothetical protein
MNRTIEKWELYRPSYLVEAHGIHLGPLCVRLLDRGQPNPLALQLQLIWFGFTLHGSHSTKLNSSLSALHFVYQYGNFVMS